MNTRENEPPKQRRPKGDGFLLRRRVKGKPLKDCVVYACYTHEGRKYRESSKSTSRAVAANLLRTRIREINQGTFAPGAARVTLGHLRDLVVADYATNGLRSAARVKGLFKNLVRLLGEGTKADKIGRKLPAYVARRLEEEVPTRRKEKPKGDVPEREPEREPRTISRATINRELAGLKRGYRLAVKAGLLATAPSIELLEEGPARKGFPEPEEIERIVTHLPDRLKAPVRFLSVTGWRVSEALRLEWRSVDLKAGTLRLEGDETKGGEIRLYPYAEHPELAALIRAQRTAADTWEREHGEIVRPVFFHASIDENGLPTASPNRVYQHAWNHACAKAGSSGRLVHDLRRYAARNLVRAGVSETVAMNLLGHRTASVFRRYNITDERDLRQAVRNLAHAQDERQAATRANA